MNKSTCSFFWRSANSISHLIQFAPHPATTTLLGSDKGEQNWRNQVCITGYWYFWTWALGAWVPPCHHRWWCGMWASTGQQVSQKSAQEVPRYEIRMRGSNSRLSHLTTGHLLQFSKWGNLHFSLTLFLLFAFHLLSQRNLVSENGI